MSESAFFADFQWICNGVVGINQFECLGQMVSVDFQRRKNGWEERLPIWICIKFPFFGRLCRILHLFGNLSALNFLANKNHQRRDVLSSYLPARMQRIAIPSI